MVKKKPHLIYWIKSHLLWQSNDYTRALKSILMSVDFIFSNLPPLCYVLKFEFINLNYMNSNRMAENAY